MHPATKLIMSLLVMLALSPVSSFASDDARETCKEAANKVSDVIVDWYQMVKDFGAESKNDSVLRMYADHTSKRLKDNFVRKCLSTWSVHQDIYTCFAGVRSEIGAAMCKHPDTNTSNWSY